MSHGTHMNESWHTYEWVMYFKSELKKLKPVWMSHVTHMTELWHTYEWVVAHIWMSHGTKEWVMAHMWMSHGTHMNESWHTYEWVMAHIWMRHVTRINESCVFERQLKMLTLIQHTATYRNTLQHTATHCNILQHTATYCNTLQHTATHCNTLHYRTSISVSWHTYEWVMSNIWMSHVTRTNESCHTHE